jgi:predicted nucleic acid-binding protein
MTTSAVAPEIVDLEILSVLRRRAREDPEALSWINDDVAGLADAPITRVTHRSMIRRIWELRHSVTPYDASYVALAEELGAPLITCDKKLAGSNGHQVEIEYFPSV